jgi:hypothetical protein
VQITPPNTLSPNLVILELKTCNSNGGKIHKLYFSYYAIIYQKYFNSPAYPYGPLIKMPIKISILKIKNKKKIKIPYF